MLNANLVGSKIHRTEIQANTKIRKLSVRYALLAALTLALNSIPCQAQRLAAAGQESVAAQCSSLESADFSGIQDAPTQVTAAKLVDAHDNAPAYCQVKGYIAPNVGIELRLPAANWNGKFLEVGCGGFCGVVWADSCNGPLRKGYACIASDMGHQSTTHDGKWAYNNLQAEADWGFRAAHVTSLAGKAISTHYYDRAPRRSYFMGCSTGGREGMVEAQRFPWDFDGIVAGAPALSESSQNLNRIWAVRSIFGKDGKPILSPAAIRLVHDAVLAKCDLDDGVKDGIIGGPRTCNFDPAALVCKAGQSSGCLSKVQADAVNKIYAGPTTSTGERIYTGGDMRGSELTWIDGFASYFDHGALNSLYPQAVGDFFRYMAFAPDPGPQWKISDLDFDGDYKRLGGAEALYTAANPDLRKFKAAHGKLIVYQGWVDIAVAPGEIVDYYETAEKTLGGRAATQDFFRLFMIPGMDHCSSGPGAFAIDYLSYLEAWVEQGRAPDKMIGTHVNGVDWGHAFALEFPLDPATPTSFTRPVYPYPTRAKFLGRGSAQDAANFGPIAP